jgi:hydrogenase-4 component E
MEKRFGGQRESQPYVNIATSLILAGLLVLLAYAITRPLVLVSTLPTRGGLPLAMGLIFVGLFVVITRKKALTQIVGFLVLENGIALLAALGTFGIPLIIELGVFLDVLMGFLVMQVLVYHIQGTFETIDVDQLSQLKY